MPYRNSDTLIPQPVVIHTPSRMEFRKVSRLNLENLEKMLGKFMNIIIITYRKPLARPAD